MRERVRFYVIIHEYTKFLNITHSSSISKKASRNGTQGSGRGAAPTHFCSYLKTYFSAEIVPNAYLFFTSI